MASQSKSLLIRIEQSQQVTEYVLSGRSQFTVGRNPDNHVVVFDSNLPKQAVLFEKRKNGYWLRLPAKCDGEVISDKTRLSFDTMLAHGLLTRKRGVYVYPVTGEKRGVIQFADTRITFTYPYMQDSKELDFSGYSWFRATFRDLRRDVPFKLVLTAVLAVCWICLSYLHGLSVDIDPQTLKPKVPARLARIIVRSSSVAAEPDLQGSEPGQSGEAEQSSTDSDEEGGSGGVESQNVLGLLAGSGNAADNGSLADFLLGEQLVRELDEVMASTDLQVGRTSQNEDAIGALIAGNGGIANGGIDDLLEGVGELESVSLSKQGKIQIEGGTGLEATADAEGKRSEESVRRILTANSGRLTYIYNKYLKHTPDLNGKLVVEVVIAADGTVDRVRKLSSSVEHPDFEREILDFIRRWHYNSIEKGTVTVTYPLIFNKVK